MIIEVIVTNVEEAVLAEECKIDRLELIHSFDLGGLSPDMKISQDVCQSVNIPVNVMLRPHGRSFVYDKAEFKQIMNELEYLRDNTKASAIVFGALDKHNRLNHEQLKIIIENKGHLGLTFHRAIDVSADPIATYRELTKYPEVDLVLTSGGKDTAMDGLNMLKHMLAINNSIGHAKILAGSGINLDNIEYITKETGCSQVHIGTGLRTNGVLDQAKFALLSSILAKL